MRSFLPKVSPTISADRYRKFSHSARVAIGSEYVIHIAEDGSQQVLFMKFQDMPEDIDVGLGLAAVSSGPKLWGMVEEFEKAPKNYRNGSASEKSVQRGSRFIVHAKAYDASKVDTHHLGGVMIDLTLAKNCDVRDMTFVDKVRPYLCLPDND